jgi:hypothetical protein
VTQEDNMRLLLSTLLLITMAATAAFGGRLFGDVKRADKPVPGVLITLQAAAKEGDTTPGPIDSVLTDKVGSYKIVIKGEGKYNLTVHEGKNKAMLEVFSYKEPTRYDLILEEKDGKLAVRRK